MIPPLVLHPLLLIYFLIFIGVEGNLNGSFVATFSPLSTGGVKGYFQYNVNSWLVGTYSWNLDLNNFIIPASAAAVGCTQDIIQREGLLYHIHSYWTNSSYDSSNICGSGTTGPQGHYDPYLACSTTSQSYGDSLCAKLDRVPSSYSYNCTNSVYSSGRVAQCEVGDLSGKFGPMISVSSTNLTFISNGIIDVNPPPAVYYANTDTVSVAPWESIVFHCKVPGISAPRLFCARLVYQDSTPSSNDDDDVKSPSPSTSAASTVLTSIVFLWVAMQFIFPFNALVPLDRRSTSLIGAAFCYIIQINHGNPVNFIDFNVFVVLFSIMIVNYIMLQQPVIVHFFTDTLTKYITSSYTVNSPKYSSSKCFWLISCVAFVTSMFITNDGLCLFLVNPILTQLAKLKHRKINKDTFFYMLTICASSNIGSACTLQGNPQNIIISSYLVQRPVLNGGSFTGYLLLPSLLCFGINTMYLDYLRLGNTGFYPLATRISKTLSPICDSVAIKLDETSVSIPCYLFFICTIILEFAGFQLSILFCYLAVALTILTVYGKYVKLPGDNKVKMQGCQSHLDGIFNSIDYNLLVIFGGLFIVSGYFLETHIPDNIYQALVINNKVDFTNVGTVVRFALYLTVGSQFIGNVPCVYIVAKQLLQINDSNILKYAFLLLAFITTIAGNLTLVGSAANLIVVEQASRHPELQIQINSVDHFKVCFPITFLLLVIGVLLISLLTL